MDDEHDDRQRLWPFLKSRSALIGAGCGVALGIVDTLGALACGVKWLWGASDITLITGVYLTTTYAVVGWVIGALIVARRELQRSSDTIRRQIEELHTTQSQLSEAQTLAALGRLAAGVAHEVRNPLGVIRSAAKLVLEDLEPGGDSYRAGEFITAEVDRLNRYVTKLLDFARPLQPELRVQPLKPLIESAERVVRENIHADCLRLEIAAKATELTAPVDADLFTTALISLLKNAGEAASGGCVEIRLQSDNGHALIDVADDGPGIPEEERAHLFQPFHTTKTDGTGLGLAMAARAVAAHGGVLEYRDRAGTGEGGRGACFRIILEGSYAGRRSR
ncbi:MAG: hypothetical protein KC609_01460 [Myxococcales bacterium]|nr:hypothetical protein [Myxococcales bacterium]